MAGTGGKATGKRKPKRKQQQGQLLQLSSDAFWRNFPTPFAGVDEAGRGCLAGPVAAAAVILPESFDLPKLNDSKLLTPDARAVLEPAIKSQALAWSVALSWPQEIDRINILQASLTAMCRAVGHLRLSPAFLAVDGNQELPMPCEQRTVIGGDSRVPAIAAASILAKTFRDRLLTSLDKRYPGYGFAGHKGYATREHYAALKRLGPCRMHRMTFRGVAPEPPRTASEQGVLDLCPPGT